MVDALTGPQLTLDGIRLIGRRPSELEAELVDYLPARGLDIHYMDSGEVGSGTLGLEPYPQRARDVLLTGAVLARPNARAGTADDATPLDVLRHRRY